MNISLLPSRDWLSDSILSQGGGWPLFTAAGVYANEAGLDGYLLIGGWRWHGRDWPVGPVSWKRGHEPHVSHRKMDATVGSNWPKRLGKFCIFKPGSFFESEKTGSNEPGVEMPNFPTLFYENGTGRLGLVKSRWRPLLQLSVEIGRKGSENFVFSNRVHFSNRKKLDRMSLVWKCQIFRPFSMGTALGDLDWLSQDGAPFSISRISILKIQKSFLSKSKSSFSLCEG